MPPNQFLPNAIATLRSLVNAIKGAGSPEAAFTNIVESLESATSIFENIATSEEAMSAKTDLMSAKIDLMQNASQSNLRNLSESRCVSSLRILGSDKAEFKNWNEQFIKRDLSNVRTRMEAICQKS